MPTIIMDIYIFILNIGNSGLKIRNLYACLKVNLK